MTARPTHALIIKDGDAFLKWLIDLGMPLMVNARITEEWHYVQVYNHELKPIWVRIPDELQSAIELRFRAPATPEP